MAKSILVPGRGEHQVLDDDERAVSAEREDKVKGWILNAEEDESLVLNWSDIMQQGAAQEAIEEVGNFARLFTAARITHHQMGTEEAPKAVQVFIRVVTGDPIAEDDQTE